MVHAVYPLDGLWLNLGASFIAIIVTILYVDRILERHDERRWHRPKKLISHRIMVTVGSNITNIRGALGIAPLNALITEPRAMHREYLKYCAAVIEPEVASQVGGLDQVGWKRLARAIEACYTNCENVLSLFASTLDPRQLELLIEMQNHLRTAALPYQTFPDLLGVPDNNLPATKSDPRELRDHHAGWAASELKEVLRSCRELGEYELNKATATA